jgi:DNA-binding protein H-NS
MIMTYDMKQLEGIIQSQESEIMALRAENKALKERIEEMIAVGKSIKYNGDY